MANNYDVKDIFTKITPREFARMVRIRKILLKKEDNNITDMLRPDPQDTRNCIGKETTHYAPSMNFEASKREENGAGFHCHVCLNGKRAGYVITSLYNPKTKITDVYIAPHGKKPLFDFRKHKKDLSKSIENKVYETLNNLPNGLRLQPLSKAEVLYRYSDKYPRKIFIKY